MSFSLFTAIFSTHISEFPVTGQKAPKLMLAASVMHSMAGDAGESCVLQKEDFSQVGHTVGLFRFSGWETGVAYLVPVFGQGKPVNVISETWVAKPTSILMKDEKRVILARIIF